MSKKKALNLKDFLSSAATIVHDTDLDCTVGEKADKIATLLAYKDAISKRIDEKVKELQNSIPENLYDAKGSVSVEHTTPEGLVTETFTVKLGLKDVYVASAFAGMTNEELKTKYNLGDELIKAKVTTIYSLDKAAMYKAYENNNKDVLQAKADGVLLLDKEKVKSISVSKKESIQ